MKKKGRGAQINPHNKFLKNEYEILDEYLNHCEKEGEEYESNRTQYIEVTPKTIVNKVESPDLNFNWSINPYQGCEHGCVYCYARNTHEYWGYSAGTDFERVILIKKNAPELLLKHFSKRTWEPDLIVLSGNTDCYQPAERKFQITKKLLEIFLEVRNPVGLITKNSLILRDLEILKELNRLNLLRLTLSITTLDEELRRKMEPRTASVKQRLKTLEMLSDAGIKVNVNLAPIVPGLNSHEVFDLVKEVGKRGAGSVTYIMVRLNGKIAEVFENWVHQAYPERARKVLNGIRETHGGSLNEARWKLRMRGQGQYAEQVKGMFERACREYNMESKFRSIPVETKLFRKSCGNQMYLF